MVETIISPTRRGGDMSMWLFSPDAERGAGYHRATSPHVPAFGSVDYLKVYIAPSLWELHDCRCSG